MYHFKLLGLTLSMLLPFTPVNYDWDNWQFPQTRTVAAHWATEFYVQDIGYKDSPTGISVNTIDEEDAVHYYVVSYIFHVECSEACYVSSGQDALSISGTSFLITSKQAYEMKASELFAIRNFTQNGANRANLTFSSASDTQSIQLQMPVMNNSTVNVNVWFKGATEGVMLDDIANHTLNASSYLLRLTLNNMLNNRTLPADVMTTYQNYINNGDYSTAYTYITNYINNQSTIENTETNNETNNYNTQHTDLINYYTIENNFANQVETDFTNQQQNIPLSDTTLNFSNQNYIKSAEWVKLRFNDLFIGTVWTPLLQFSLISGLIFALIGRFKR